jgi:hypothetical protein
VTEELQTLFDVAAQLEREGIPYMISGSMAMNYYAQPRMTRDVDIVVDLSAASATKLSALLDKDFFMDADVAREAALKRRMFNAIHKQRLVKVDFVVRKDDPYRQEEFRRRQLIDMEGEKIWMVAPEDLVLSKLYWAKDSRSEMQIRDVRNLLATVKSLDLNYLERWAKVLGVGALLEEARK